MDKCFVCLRCDICLFLSMSTESLNRTSGVDEDPSLQPINTKVNIDIIMKRMIDQKKKERVKRTIIFSSVCVSLGVLTILSFLN